MLARGETLEVAGARSLHSWRGGYLLPEYREGVTLIGFHHTNTGSGNGGWLVTGIDVGIVTSCTKMLRHNGL